MRVTKAGFDKITAILPGLLNDQLSGGFCVGTGQVGTPSGGFLATGGRYCGTNQSAQPSIPDACGASNGCNVGVHLDSTVFQVVNAQAMNVRIQLDVDAAVPVSGQVVGIGFSCTLTASGPNIAIDADLAFGIDPATGKLTLELAGINGLDTSDLSFDGCSVVSDVANLLNSLLNSFIGDFLIDLLEPTFNSLIQGFLPDPLGIEGMMDVGAMLADISPSTKATLEARLIPGGYVGLQNNGLSLGLITGFNADEDLRTRTPDLDSEPALCVPPIPAPNYGAPPANLPISSRGTFQLIGADQLIGSPDPVGTDLAIGLSETTLDLIGHHLVTSGGMCMGIDSSVISALNVGTIGILVPSLAELGSDEGTDPLLLMLRPQRAIDFTIGDNTAASPAITLGLNNFEIDLYGFISERYVRALTLDLTVNVGINLDFIEDPATMTTKIRPTLIGLSSSNVVVKVHNSEFVRETPAELEMVLPTIFDLLTGLLTIPDIDVPSFAGFKLQNLSVQHIVTSQDDFVALFAGLGASTMMRTVGEREPLMATAIDLMDAELPAAQPVARVTPKLVGVVTPGAEQIRGALRKAATGKLPEIQIEAPSHDTLGRELEWSYRFDAQGLWRAYRATPGGMLVISENGLALQGKHTVELVARVKGDYRTNTPVSVFDVTLDSIGPRIIGDKQAWNTDGQLEIPIYDLVTDRAKLQYGFGHVGDDAPIEWFTGGVATIDRATLDSLKLAGQVAVFAKDETGNVTTLFLTPSGDVEIDGGGCGCATSGPSSGGVALATLLGAVLAFGGRRRRALVASVARRGRRLLRAPRAMQVIAVAAIACGSAFVPACSCGNTAETICEVNDDCDEFCPFGQEGLCMNNMCSCELTAGRTGPYSDVAPAGDGTVWVSAYSQTFGDLVIANVPDAGRIPDEAWQWVDGVPDEPPTVDASSIRGGITGEGPDVGMYTSIAVAPDGTPMVSYFDRDNASLMFAYKNGDGWSKHVVDAGGPGIEGTAVKSGMYTSLTLRTDDGRPGIAYLAHVLNADGSTTAEVRFVAAQTAKPTSAADWQQWKVDAAPVIENPDEVYPLPGGLGLFVDSARLPSQAPVLVYYDRANGELRMSKLDPNSGEFTTPVVLDGASSNAGWGPSVTVDAEGKVRVAYISTSNYDLMYIVEGGAPEIIDDGYRIVGLSPDGLPKPEYHLVGDDANIVMPPGGGEPIVTYQDATTQELLMAQRRPDGSGWTYISLAGHTDPWPGAYGFFAANALSGNDLVISTWVIDQPADMNWVEIFKRPTIVQ